MGEGKNLFRLDSHISILIYIMLKLNIQVTSIYSKLIGIAVIGIAVFPALSLSLINLLRGPSAVLFQQYHARQARE